MTSKLSRLATCCLLVACGAEPVTSPPAPTPTPVAATVPTPTPTPVAVPTPTAVAAAAPAAMLADSSAEGLLFDFRTRALSRAPAPPAPTISPAEASAVNAAIGGKVKLDKAQCGEGNSGSFQRILERRQGAFTAPNAEETLYLVITEFCEPALREAQDNHFAVIFADGVAVAAFSGEVMGDAKSDSFWGEKILAALDLDQDGIVELLTSTNGDGQGIFVERARLYSFKARKLALLQDFLDVYTDGCASDMEESNIEAHVLSHTPAATVSVRRFTASCVKSGKYVLSDFSPAP
jgi:hypothetical protein